MRIFASKLHAMTNFLTDIPKDKLLHVLYASIITSILKYILPLWWLIGVACVIFAGKEIYDKLSGKGTPEWKDLLADCVGFLIGFA